MVKNPTFGKEAGERVSREVPWREGTAIRSATHSDLLKLLSPLQGPILSVEVGNGRGFVNEYPLKLSLANRMALHTKRTMHSPPVPTTAYYLRVCVVNRGRRAARGCKAYLANVEVQDSKEFHETRYADFMRLVWSHHARLQSLDLLPEVPHWLDVVSTKEHDSRFFLRTDPQSTRYADGFGDTSVYRLTIRLFAEDAEPVQTFVYLHWKGQWNSLDVFDDAEWESRNCRG